MIQRKIHKLLSCNAGGIVVLGMLLFIQVAAVADAVLLTNRAEKHRDNPNAIIHESAPDPTWRIPRTVPTLPPMSTEQLRPNFAIPQHSTLIYAPIHNPHASTYSTRMQDQKSQASSTNQKKTGNAQGNEDEESLKVPVMAISVLESPSSRIRPDGLGGHRITDGTATVQVRPDGLGGYRAGQRSTTGSSTRVRPDGLGGYRVTSTKTGQQAQNASVRPDGLGGYRINNSDGSTHRVRPDGLGGYRVTDADGKVSRIRPDGLGGYQQR